LSNRSPSRPPPRPSIACPPKRLPSLAWKVSPIHPSLLRSLSFFVFVLSSPPPITFSQRW
jgi:hypothetical protein